MSPLSPAVLYAVFALGAVAVYLAMPGGQRPARIAALVLGLAAVAGLVVASAVKLLPGGAPSVAFCALAGIAVLAAAKVVTHAKPVYSAVYFILVVSAVAGLMVLQEAEFLGIALVIVYGGAILVTYVFVIMLAQQSGASPTDLRPRAPLMAVLLGFMAMAAIAGQMADLPSHGPGLSEPGLLGPDRARESPARSPGVFAESNTAGVGAELLSRYVVALEIGGVLLLVAMIGAIVMAKKRVPLEVPQEPSPVPGEIGRAVEPF